VAQIQSYVDKCIADVEVKVRSAETHVVEIATEDDKNLRDFESGLV
jgi:hypothetical protein